MSWVAKCLSFLSMLWTLIWFVFICSTHEASAIETRSWPCPLQAHLEDDFPSFLAMKPFRSLKLISLCLTLTDTLLIVLKQLYLYHWFSFSLALKTINIIHWRYWFFGYSIRPIWQIETHSHILTCLIHPFFIFKLSWWACRTSPVTHLHSLPFASSFTISWS